MRPARVDAVVANAHLNDRPKPCRLQHSRGRVQIQHTEPGGGQRAEGAHRGRGVEVGVDEVDVFVGGAHAEGRGGKGKALGERFVHLGGDGGDGEVVLGEAEAGQDRPEEEDSAVEIPDDADG